MDETTTDFCGNSFASAAVQQHTLSIPILPLQPHSRLHARETRIVRNTSGSDDDTLADCGEDCSLPMHLTGTNTHYCSRHRRHCCPLPPSSSPLLLYLCLCDVIAIAVAAATAIGSCACLNVIPLLFIWHISIAFYYPCLPPFDSRELDLAREEGKSSQLVKWIDFRVVDVGSPDGSDSKQKYYYLYQSKILISNNNNNNNTKDNKL